MQPDFFSLSTNEVAEIVQMRGPDVCVIPINGTRRWFALERQLQEAETFTRAFMHDVGKELRRIIAMLFDHGVNCVLTPIYGEELEGRGGEYVQGAMEGLRRLTVSPFRDFYHKEGIRVHFYGDYHQALAEIAPDLPEAFRRVESETAKYDAHRLFYGVSGTSAVKTITAYAAQIGRPLTQREAIEVFYGEPIPSADLFIGFDAPTAFDMPLLDAGDVALYFTIAPSPYIDQKTLRAILHDWIYVRHDEEADYDALDSEDWYWMKRYYRDNRHKVIGLGQRRAGIWYPVDSIGGIDE